MSRGSGRRPMDTRERSQRWRDRQQGLPVPVLKGGVQAFVTEKRGTKAYLMDLYSRKRWPEDFDLDKPRDRWMARSLGYPCPINVVHCTTCGAEGHNAGKCNAELGAELVRCVCGALLFPRQVATHRHSRLSIDDYARRDSPLGCAL